MCSSSASVYFRLVLNSSRTSEIVTSPLSRANSTTRARHLFVCGLQINHVLVDPNDSTLVGKGL